jgi:protocatechuate 3,4-dioxygenase alpha subunit
MSKDTRKITTSQTIGPFSHEAWQWAVDGCHPDRLQTSAPTITISGRVFDGDGAPVNDAQIEAWLPEAEACEAGQPLPAFRRLPTGDQGEFSLRLSMPPRVDDSSAGEPAAYITVFARGLTKHQFTAVFLEDDPALPQSAILEQVPAARRATLIANKLGDAEYRWDIWLQTDKETVFFDYT